MASSWPAPSSSTNYYRLLFSIAVLFGLVYLFLVPPWQHNDEPGHFEYAWLAANQETWPQPGDYNQAMRREVAASMIEHGFFRSQAEWPNLLVVDEPVWIGISQVGDPPLYYLLASIPLRVFRYADITFQLYAARFISYFLYLLTVWFGIRASKELFSENRLLAMTVPAFFALLPGFVDLMTAVNDDAMAVTAMTLFFWAGIKIIKRGISIRHMIFLAVSIGLCLMAKRTSWLALPLGVLVIYLSLIKNRRWAILAGVALIIVAAGGTTLTWREKTPAYFYARHNYSQPRQMLSAASVEGEKVLSARTRGGAFHQTLGQNRVKPLRDQEISLGVWAWAAEPARVAPPQLTAQSSNILAASEMELSLRPQLFVFSGRVSENARTLVLSLPMSSPVGGVEVYWDCFFLIEGSLNGGNIIPSGKNCAQLSIDGVVKENYLKNASAEKGWPLLRSEAAQWVDRHFNYSVAHLWAVFDLDAAEDYFVGTATHLFRTFWGRFGWGQVVLLGGKPYRLFVFLTALAVLGGILGWIRNRRSMDWGLITFLSIAVFVQAGLVLFRAAGNWYNYIYTPNARYFYPALYPMAVFLGTGWLSLYKFLLNDRLKIDVIVSVLSGLMVVFNIWAWISIWKFFFG